MILYFKKMKQKIQEGILQEMWNEAKWMFPYTKRYWKFILYYMVLGVAGTGMGLAGSIASKYLIDAVTGYNSSNMAFIIVIILSMALGNIAVGAVSSRISIKIDLKVNNEIRADIYDKIMNTDWEAVSEYHSGDLLNRFNGDVGTVADSVIGWIPTLITRTLQFIGTLAVILYYDSTMALIALLSAPITLIMSKMLMTRMREYNKQVRQVSSEMMSFNEESLQNIQIIKCFDLIEFFGHRLKNVQDKFAVLSLEYNKFSIYTSSFLSVVGLGVSYAIYGWGVYRLWSGYITYGTMTLFIQLSGFLSSSFSALIGMVPAAIGATTSAGRIMDIVELPREKEKNSGSVEPYNLNTPNQRVSVKFSHINYKYRGRDMVLQNICFHVEPQEIVAIIGPSGEGKTTLIRILLGLLYPTGGEAKLIDSNGAELSISNSTRRFFSYVPQGNTIFSGTIAENLRMIKPDATDEELIASLKAACAYSFIEGLPDGIYTKVGEKGGGFSEGQMQRLSIARAVLRDAPIMLLDEATSALDAETEENVLHGIMAYGKTHTCILTTHRQSVLSMCDKVYRINKTQLEEISEELSSEELHPLAAVNY